MTDSKDTKYVKTAYPVGLDDSYFQETQPEEDAEEPEEFTVLDEDDGYPD